MTPVTIFQLVVPLGHIISTSHCLWVGVQKVNTSQYESIRAWQETEELELVQATAAAAIQPAVVQPAPQSELDADTQEAVRLSLLDQQTTNQQTATAAPAIEAASDTEPESEPADGPAADHHHVMIEIPPDAEPVDETPPGDHLPGFELHNNPHVNHPEYSSVSQ